MNKTEIHKEICEKIHKLYKAKNADYGDSFAKVRKKYPDTFFVHANEKLERAETLFEGKEQQVKDESIEDTLFDLANYCIMELVERTYGIVSITSDEGTTTYRAEHYFKEL